ncbi:MAG: zinc ribbon domain-containing protein [Syntrophobacteraceae bacterium]
MFFFIGGIQPKTVNLDDIQRLCPSCGLTRARLKRVDHYLSLFFIPLFPVKRGEPALICDRCGAVSSGDLPLRTSYPESRVDRCTQCGNAVERAFRYCPHCGKRL